MAWFRCGQSVPPPALLQMASDLASKTKKPSFCRSRLFGGFTSVLLYLLYFALFYLILRCLCCHGAEVSGQGHLPAPPRSGGHSPCRSPEPPSHGSALLPFPASLFIFPEKKSAACLFQTQVPLRGGVGNVGDIGGFSKV